MEEKDSKGKILVTGGTGFIGSHTAIELLSAGYHVEIIDSLSNSDADMIDRIEEISGKTVGFEKLDLLDAKGLDNYFESKDDIKGIIHFAALKSVGESVQEPLLYYKNNVQGLINLLDQVKKHGILNFVFSSSCTVYGSPDELPVTENAPIKHTPSPYGATKQMAERILDDFVLSADFFQSISLRYFNPLGAHPSGLIGELPSGIPNNLLPYITQTAAGIRDCLSVFGDDYPTPDGTGVRDYIHVCDVAEAHVKAIDYLLSRGKNENKKINIGTGIGLSVLEVIQSFERTSGLSLNYKIEPRREGDVAAVYADATLAKNTLEWEAKYSIDDMTKSAWEWEKRYRGL